MSVIRTRGPPETRAEGGTAEADSIRFSEKEEKMKKCIFFVFWNCEEKLVNYKIFLLLKCRPLFCFCRQNSSTDVETMKRRNDVATF
jgi:hypothetical protein